MSGVTRNVVDTGHTAADAPANVGYGSAGAGAPAAADKGPGAVVDGGRSLVVIDAAAWSVGGGASAVAGWAFQLRINRPRVPAYHPRRHSSKCVVPAAARCTPTCSPHAALAASSQNCAVVRDTDVTLRQPVLPAFAFSVLR